METADGATGDGDEQAGEQGAVGQRLARQALPQLGQVGMLHKEHHHQGGGHEQQREGEQRVYLADDLVDGQHRGHQVVDEDDGHPEHVGPHIVDDEGRLPHAAQDLRWAVHEHGSHHDEQEDAEEEHHLLRGLPQVVAYQLGLVGSAVAHAEHAAQVVVGGTGEDAAQHNPKIGRRPELSAHDGSEDGARTGYVQELNHENLPARQHNEVHTVGLSHGRCGAVVGAEDALYEASVEAITQNESHEAQCKSNHIVLQFWVQR